MTKAHILKKYFKKFYNIDAEGMTSTDVLQDYMKKKFQYDSKASSFVSALTEIIDNDLKSGGESDAYVVEVLPDIGEDGKYYILNEEVYDLYSYNSYSKDFGLLATTAAFVKVNEWTDDLTAGGYYIVNGNNMTIRVYEGSDFLEISALIVSELPEIGTDTIYAVPNHAQKRVYVYSGGSFKEIVTPRRTVLTTINVTNQGTKDVVFIGIPNNQISYTVGTGDIIPKDSPTQTFKLNTEVYDGCAYDLYTPGANIVSVSSNNQNIKCESQHGNNSCLITGFDLVQRGEEVIFDVIVS